jgi:hypothetical protein
MNLRDERFLPFEGAGAVSTWTLSLPSELRLFDYSTISDVIFHIRYTARLAGVPLQSQATKELIDKLASQGDAEQAVLFCLRFDFPTEWSAFVSGGADFTANLTTDFFPYLVQKATMITVDSLTLYAAGGNGTKAISSTPDVKLDVLSNDLVQNGASVLSLKNDNVMLREQTRQVFMVVRYHFAVK